MIIEFDDVRWLVVRRDETYGVAHLAEWNLPVKDYLVREFAGQASSTQAISLEKLVLCPVLLTTYRL